MARTRPAPKLATREGRRKLQAQADPYWLSLAPGEALGYMKPKSGSAGTWRARIYLPETRTFRKKALGAADDFQDADGRRVLSFAEAQRKAQGWFDEVRQDATGEAAQRGPLTVAGAVEAYLSHAERRGMKSAADARRRVALHILPSLGPVPVEKLTRLRVERWLDHLAASPKAKTRTKRPAPKTKETKAEPPQPPPSTPDEKRARKATANRILATLKAALTYARSRNLVRCSSDAWAEVRPFRGTEEPRREYLTPEEQQRLLNAIKDPDFKALVSGALATGCRYGELSRMTVGDFDPVGGTVLVAEAKGGKPRHVPLTREGRAFFASITAGRNRREPLFTREAFKGMRRVDPETGEPIPKVRRAWGTAEQVRPMADACRAAGLPLMGFHQLRHSYASALVAAGMPLAFVAKLTGHSDTRMLEKHYAHLAPSDVKKALETFAPGLDLGTPAVESLKIKRG